MKEYMNAAARQGILLAILVILTSGQIFSLEPPRIGEMEKYRQDGTFELRQNFARELGNNKVSTALAARFSSKMNGRCAMAPPIGWQGLPTTGNVKVLALLIGFSDYEPNTSAELVNSRLFQDGPGTFPYDSLRNFYLRSSYGMLEISGNALGWYIAPYPRSSVPETTSGREKLIKEALNHFEAEGHDFSQYDNDGDGTLDYLVVVWTGPDTGWANFWWGYDTYFQDGSYKLDGKSIGNYSWQWEANPVGGKFSPRVAIHETGHALGLPDYYDYDDTIGPRGGVGGLDQMDGWGDHNSFSKMLLEWLDPVVVSSGTSSPVLTSSSDSPDAVILMPEAKEGDQFAEYYMIQYRTRTGNDIAIPNEGILIWHLDARTDSGGYDFLFDNSYSDHKLLRLMEADGLEEIEQNKWADAGDFYTEGAEFSGGTVPGSFRYCGLPSGISLGNISEAGEVISCDVALPSEAVTLTSVKKLKDPFKLMISGSGIKEGATAVIGGDSDSWAGCVYKEGSLVLEKGKKLKRRFYKGSPVKIIVINTDGSAGSITYTR